MSDANHILAEFTFDVWSIPVILNWKILWKKCEKHTEIFIWLKNVFSSKKSSFYFWNWENKRACMRYVFKTPRNFAKKKENNREPKECVKSLKVEMKRLIFLNSIKIHVESMGAKNVSIIESISQDLHHIQTIRGTQKKRRVTYETSEAYMNVKWWSSVKNKLQQIQYT